MQALLKLEGHCFTDEYEDHKVRTAELLRKKRLLSELSQQVEQIRVLTQKIDLDTLQREFNANFTSIVHNIQKEVGQIQNQISSSSSFYSFVLNTHLAVNSPERGYFGFLPDEIVIEIFTYLEAIDLCRVAQVCSSWRVLSADDRLWRRLCERRWSLSDVEAHETHSKKPFKWLYNCKHYVFPSNKMTHGIGSFTLSNGNRYEGEWENQTRHGWGTSYMTNGRIYIGEWHKDKRNGHGIFTWPGGDVYEGMWKNSKRHGSGTYTWADGRVYKGEWMDDKRHGFGISTYPDGHRYEGEYKDGKRDGHGTCIYPNGGRYEGEYFFNKRHGGGTYFWPDGDKYDGMWREGKRFGKGKLTRADGSVYEQDWNEENFVAEHKFPSDAILLSLRPLEVSDECESI